MMLTMAEKERGGEGQNDDVHLEHRNLCRAHVDAHVCNTPELSLAAEAHGVYHQGCECQSKTIGAGAKDLDTFHTLLTFVID